MIICRVAERQFDFPSVFITYSDEMINQWRSALAHATTAGFRNYQGQSRAREYFV